MKLTAVTLLVTSLPLLGAGAAHATDAVSELVVTGAPYAVSIDSTTTHVDVLTTEALLQATPAGLGDVLDGLPGLRSSSYGPGASRPVIRGLSGPRVLILQNGTGLVDASALSPDHAVAADPGLASRVEVLRGPSALAYGGSAIGGVVNVIDDRIASTPLAGTEGRAVGSYTTNGEGLAGAFSLRSGRGAWVLTLDGEHRQADDYEAATTPVSAALAQDEGVTALTDRRVANSDVELSAIGAGLSYVGTRGFIGLSVKDTSTDYGIPYPQVAGATPPDDVIGIDLAQTRYDLRGEIGFHASAFERVRVAVGHTDYHHSELNRAAGEVGTQFLAKGTEGRLELVQRARGGWQGAVGAQALDRRFQAIGDEAFIPSTAIDEVAAFTLQRYDAGRWGLEGGLRLDRRRLVADLLGRDTSDAGQASVLGLDWSSADPAPAFETISAALGVFARPTDTLFLALTASSNERAPTEFELFSDGPHEGTGAYQVGDPSLGSETARSAEATVRYKRGRWKAEGHVFHAHYDGYIDEAPNGLRADDEGTLDPAGELPVYVYSQGRANFRGGEIELAYALHQGPSGTFWLEGVVDAVRGSVGGATPARIPPLAYTVRGVWEGERLEASLEARTAQAQQRVAAFERPTDGYTVVNARLAYKLFADREVTVFAEGRNLTNEEAREHTSFLKDIAPRPGRSLRVGMATLF